MRARWRDAQASNSSLPYFIAGEENRLAGFVCQSETGVFELGNPLLLTGAVGTGKTCIALHLAARQAISMGIAANIESVKYLPAVDFAREYAEAASSDDMPPFRESIDNAPILVIDDLHLIADKTPAQEELAARIEARSNAQKPTLLTCRRLPSEVRSMRSRLVSRALHGLTIALSPPQGKARLLILAELAMTHDLSLDDVLLERLAEGLSDKLSVRALDAAMKQLSLWCRMNNAAVDAKAIENVINQSSQGSEVELSKITQTVARQMGIKTADLRSSSRKQTVVRGRSLAMYIARQATSKSLADIGKYFGGRDHTTVLHAIRKTESVLQDDVDLHRVFNEVNEKIAGYAISEPANFKWHRLPALPA